MDIRLPAEWEEQDGILLAWPHEKSDWAYMLDEVRTLYANLIRQISRFERVLLATPHIEETREWLSAKGVPLEMVTICGTATNDTWTRDYGPITVEVNKNRVMLDFGFNGWGLKFPADLDNQFSRSLKNNGAFTARLNTIGLILEGGSIESDGAGTVMTTSRCLLSPNRNPQLDRNEIEAALSSLLGARNILWLEHGHLEGDDTDAHIDTLARLCPDNTILYVSCDNPDDPHYSPLQEMETELRGFRTITGEPYRLIPLPWPSARHDQDGNRLPATYANFLVINGAVLVPTYGDPSDSCALAMVALAFPGREITGVDCLPLIQQHGSLHCITMQMPKGTLS